MVLSAVSDQAQIAFFVPKKLVPYRRFYSVPAALEGHRLAKVEGI